MEKNKCSRYETCGSPLCPLDEESMKFGIWYADEPTCTRKGWSSFKWIRTQKNLVKWKNNPELYWDVERLNRVVQQSSKGQDPDKVVRKEKAKDMRTEGVSKKV